jgi:hypothetical protein
MDGRDIAVTERWKQIAAELPPGWQEMAEEIGLVNRSYPAYMRTKVTEISQPLRLVLYQAATNSSLAETVSKGAAAGIVEMSAVGLHKWMRKIGPYLAKLLTMMTGAEVIFYPERWGGYEVIGVGGTSVLRPGPKGTTAWIHYALRMTTLRPHQVAMTRERCSKAFCEFRAAPGQIWLGSRRYASPLGLAAIKDAGGEVVVRYDQTTFPLYVPSGNDVLSLSERLAELERPGDVGQWAAEVRLEDDRRIGGRLCAARLTSAKDNVERPPGSQSGPGRQSRWRNAIKCVVVFTTVPASGLSADQVVTLYRSSRAIGIHIKRDELQTAPDRLPNARDDTVCSWLGAKLLLAQISRRATAADKTKVQARKTGRRYPPESLRGHGRLHNPDAGREGDGQAAVQPPRRRYRSAP